MDVVFLAIHQNVMKQLQYGMQWQAGKWNYCFSEKNDPGINSCQLNKDYQILIIFDANILDTTGYKMTCQVIILFEFCFY